MTTHRNHYVPKWYQRRFFKKPDVGLYYIDSTTSQGVAAQAAQVREHKRHSPKFCFWGEDLYTTILLGTPNDDTQDVAPKPIVPTVIGFAPSPIRVSIAEAAALLRMSRAQLYNRINDDAIKSHKDGARTYIARSELERYVDSCS